MILKYEEMKNKKIIYRRTAILEQNVEYTIFGIGNTIHFRIADIHTYQYRKLVTVAS